jgi:phage terminase large subunit-like protein
VTTLVVPPLEATPYPTLGPGIAAFAERYLRFGPGDLRGEPYRFSPEKRGLLYRAYEVQPPDHPQAGRRRFRRVAISLRKGLAKTEWAAIIAACELHPDAPVRFSHWERVHGALEPVGTGVTDPYVPMIAVSEEQSDELAYGALRTILELSPLRDDFDIGLERIVRRGGGGKAESVAGVPDARDGARTTVSVFDETHRWTLPRARAAHQTMLANLPKRRAADPWALEITTAFSPGEDSVAERTWEYAEAVNMGERIDSRLFFFHRQASAKHDLNTREGRTAAVLEASGADAAWSDVEGIVDQWDDPKADRQFLARVWTNQHLQSADRAFDAQRWAELAMPHYVPPDGALISLGFDGSRVNDATGIVGTEIKTGIQFVVACWERPAAAISWEVPVLEVDDAMTAAFARWTVWRLVADESKWESVVATWAGRYGDDPKTHEPRVIKWPTYAPRRTGQIVRSFHNAITTGELHHDGNEAYARHIANAHRKNLSVRDDDGAPLWWIEKERPDSPKKIDLAMAGILSFEGRRAVIELGVLEQGQGSVYDDPAYGLAMV